MDNIWTSFSKELGFTTASIQYVELTLRIANSEHKEELSDKKIINKAKQYNLSVSEIPEDINIRIAKNYIIQIHSCVERFLHDYHSLVGSATYKLDYNRNKDNFLHWTIQNVFKEKLRKYEKQYRICNYYRYVRNESIHSDDNLSVQYKDAYSAISPTHEERLSAPNLIENLQFDDQVLYARTARELIKAIYSETQYSWKEIIEEHKAKITFLIKPYADRRKQRIENYLKSFYPIPPQGIDELENLIDTLWPSRLNS